MPPASLAMPILDCDNYCQPAMTLALDGLKHALQEAGHDIGRTKVSYVNIYFGVEELRPVVGPAWSVCRSRDHGFLTVVFHFVRHGDFVKTKEAQLRKREGLCVTLAWTTAGHLAAELADALEVADNIVAQAEMVLGRPMPLPLKKTQIPNQFCLRTVDLGAPRPRRRTVSLHRQESTNERMLQPWQIERIGVLSGAMGPLSEHLGEPLAQALHVPAKWQRQAIRAIGVEDWAAIVVASSIWIETLLVRLAILLNETAEIPIPDAKKELKKKGALRFASRHLDQKFLFGNWNRTGDGNAYGKWYRDCHSLRNKIVHEGHFPSENEARAAYQAANGLAWSVTRDAARNEDPKLSKILKGIRIMSTDDDRTQQPPGTS